MPSLFNAFIIDFSRQKTKQKYHLYFSNFCFALIIIYSLSLLSGCNSTNSIPYPAKDNILSTLKSHTIIPQPVPIIAWTPSSAGQSTGETIRIYIEGDGKAWIRRGRPSFDPTPDNRLVQYLMQEDGQTDIAYLGRPCQYKQTDQCHSKIWTFDRYSKSIIDLMNQAVNRIKQQGSYQHIELVGYSGGATIALLLAAQRNDITSVRTVAGNLDPAFTNHLHGVSDMPNAINPVEFSKTLSQIPQVHFYGNNDSTIPGKISSHYLSKMSETACIQIQSVNATHYSGWAEQWKELIKVKPECKNNKKL